MRCAFWFVRSVFLLLILAAVRPEDNTQLLFRSSLLAPSGYFPDAPSRTAVRVDLSNASNQLMVINVSGFSCAAGRVLVFFNSCNLLSSAVQIVASSRPSCAVVVLITKTTFQNSSMELMGNFTAPNTYINISFCTFSAVGSPLRQLRPPLRAASSSIAILLTNLLVRDQGVLAFESSRFQCTGSIPCAMVVVGGFLTLDKGSHLQISNCSYSCTASGSASVFLWLPPHPDLTPSLRVTDLSTVRIKECNLDTGTPEHSFPISLGTSFSSPLNVATDRKPVITISSSSAFAVHNSFLSISANSASKGNPFMHATEITLTNRSLWAFSKNTMSTVAPNPWIYWDRGIFSASGSSYMSMHDNSFLGANFDVIARTNAAGVTFDSTSKSLFGCNTVRGNSVTVSSTTVQNFEPSSVSFSCVSIYSPSCTYQSTAFVGCFTPLTLSSSVQVLGFTCLCTCAAGGSGPLCLPSVPPFNLDEALCGGNLTLSQDGIATGVALCPPAPVLFHRMILFNNWPAGLNLSPSFRGAAFDGSSLWMAPMDARAVVRLTIATGAMAAFSKWPGGVTLGATAFAGAAFDGQFVWLAPCNANAVVRVRTSTGGMEHFDQWPAGLSLGGAGGCAFLGAVFDGSFVWLTPYGATGVVRITRPSGEMTMFSAWPSGLTYTDSNKFAGGTFDGSSIWMPPRSANAVVRIATATGQMTLARIWPPGLQLGTEAFGAAAFDGAALWIPPRTANGVVQLRVANLSMTLFNQWPAGLQLRAYAFNSATFDGARVWLSPRTANGVVSMQITDGAMELFSHWPSGFDFGNGQQAWKRGFGGIVFDGRSLWQIPFGANGVVKMQSFADTTHSGTTSIAVTSSSSPSFSNSEIASLSSSLSRSRTSAASASGWSVSGFMLSASASASATFTSEASVSTSMLASPTASWIMSVAAAPRVLTTSRSASPTQLRSGSMSPSMKSRSVSQIASLSTPMTISALLTSSQAWEISASVAFSGTVSSMIQRRRSRSVTLPPASAEPKPIVSEAVLSTAQAAISTGMVASVAAGPGSAADMQSMVLATLARCTTSDAGAASAATTGGYKLLTPFALSDTAVGAVAGNAAALGGLAAVQLLAVAVNSWARGLPRVEALAAARFPGYSLLLAVSLHQATFFASIRLLGSSAKGIEVMAGIAGLLVSLLLPVIVGVAAWRVPRQFVMYEIAAGSRFAQAPLRFVVPSGVLLPSATRRIASSTITSFQMPHVWCPMLPFVSSFVINLAALLPPTAPRWLCAGSMYLSATVHVSLALVLLAMRVFRFPSSSALNALGFLVVGIFHAQVASGLRSGINSMILLQSFLSIARGVVSLCMFLLEKSLRKDTEHVRLERVKWVVAGVATTTALPNPADGNVVALISSPVAPLAGDESSDAEVEMLLAGPPPERPLDGTPQLTESIALGHLEPQAPQKDPTASTDVSERVLEDEESLAEKMHDDDRGSSSKLRETELVDRPFGLGAEVEEDDLRRAMRLLDESHAARRRAVQTTAAVIGSETARSDDGEFML
jgi:hypothetical protein